MKRTLPTYSLDRIKSAFDHENKLRTTLSARSTINDLNISDCEVVDIIQNLSLKDFYKTMPPIHKDYTSWQDVYKPKYRGQQLYVKFQINAGGEIIVSFKRSGRNI